MMSISFECLADLPVYSAWLAAQSWVPAYRRHRRNLQLIGLPDGGKRWVLKNPSHLFALDALLEVYPDALVIQTRRSPRTAIASMCSLSAHAARGWSTTFTGEVIGRGQLALWGRGMERFSADRAKHDPAQFIDVDYQDFIADPIGTIETIYQYFGLPLTEDARAAMSTVHAQSSTGERRPTHRYELSDFGLSAAEVDEQFPHYNATVSR